MMNGEFWRLFTFSFVHLNINHLIGNVIAFIVTAMLTLEIGLKSEYFMILFFSSALVIALIQGMFLPTLIIAGASLGIYSILGGISIAGKELISIYIFAPLVLLSIFLTSIFSGNNDFFEAFFHFFGFLFGLITYFAIKRYTAKRKNNFEVIA